MPARLRRMNAGIYAATTIIWENCPAACLRKNGGPLEEQRIGVAACIDLGFRRRGLTVKFKAGCGFNGSRR